MPIIQLTKDALFLTISKPRLGEGGYVHPRSYDNWVIHVRNKHREQGYPDTHIPAVPKHVLQYAYQQDFNMDKYGRESWERGARFSLIEGSVLGGHSLIQAPQAGIAPGGVLNVDLVDAHFFRRNEFENERVDGPINIEQVRMLVIQDSTLHGVKEIRLESHLIRDFAALIKGLADLSESLPHATVASFQEAAMRGQR